MCCFIPAVAPGDRRLERSDRLIGSLLAEGLGFGWEPERLSEERNEAMESQQTLEQRLSKSEEARCTSRKVLERGGIAFKRFKDLAGDESDWRPQGRPFIRKAALGGALRLQWQAAFTAARAGSWAPAKQRRWGKTEPWAAFGSRRLPQGSCLGVLRKISWELLRRRANFFTDKPGGGA